MVVGKTQPSITMADIFNVFSETEVLSSVFPDIHSLPCLINSPLRQDRHPSFSIYVNDSGNVRYTDFATNDRGGLLDLLCKYWNCNFSQCLQRINKMFIGKDNITVSHIKPSHRLSINKKSSVRLEVKVRQWEDYDIDYWQSYGCNIDLLKYCEVYPISHKIIYKDNKKYIFAAPKYSYVFTEHKEGKTTKKVYSPYATKYKWMTDNDSSVIGLWDKVPEYGDRLCICSSLKDAVALWSNSGMPCVYIQGEAFDMSDTAIGELKRRFKTVFICLDNDKWGIEDAKKLAERTGFYNIELPQFNGGKDISDFIKANGTQRFKEEIVPLFTIKEIKQIV